ncbi:MAG: signal peptidase II [Candidatus Omnitrophica bacterium]|nr:signal peptidase II [Candidatus Omnitrophota bacterium]
MTLLISISIFILDQLTKTSIKYLIAVGDSIPVIKDVFHITLVFNKGAAFGILKTQNSFFIIIAVVAAIFIVYSLPRLKKDEFFVNTAFSLLLGGIFGNLIDRLRFGYVIDFLDFRIWPVFNVADCAISIGAALVAIHLLRLKFKR